MSDPVNAYQVAGIYSKQPWFVLNATQFLTHIPAENPVVSHFYSFEMEQSKSLAIPDGCVDFLFECNEGQLFGQVFGTRSEASNIYFKPRHRYFGVRFIPGIIPGFLEVSAQELIDQQYDFLDVVPDARHIFEQVVSLSDFAEQVAVFSRFLQRKSMRKPTQLTAQAVAEICRQKGNIRIKDLEKNLGYCSRTLQRQFLHDTGLSPKAFSRAIRCQSAVYDINHRREIVFSELAFDLGFSDQSHFLREFKRLVSTTPLDYQTQVKQRAYLERIRCY
jgi:AraC-like DNA-binding protein